MTSYCWFLREVKPPVCCCVNRRVDRSHLELRVLRTQVTLIGLSDFYSFGTELSLGSFLLNWAHELNFLYMDRRKRTRSVYECSIFNALRYGWHSILHYPSVLIMGLYTIACIGRIRYLGSPRGDPIRQTSSWPKTIISGSLEVPSYFILKQHILLLIIPRRGYWREGAYVEGVVNTSKGILQVVLLMDEVVPGWTESSRLLTLINLVYSWVDPVHGIHHHLQVSSTTFLAILTAYVALPIHLV